MPVKRALLLDPKDNVASLLEEALPGDKIHMSAGNQMIVIEAEEHIPFGFKAAIRDIRENEPIIKYGHQIGIANTIIQKGALVHVHNMAGSRGRGDLRRTE